MIRLRALSFLAALPLITISRPVFAESNPSLNQTAYFNLEEEEADSISEELQGEVSFSITGRRYDDAIVNSRWGRGAIEFELKKKFNSYLSGKFAAEQRFTSGAASNNYALTDGSATPQATLLDEFSVTLKALEGLKGSIGIMPVGLNPIYSSMNIQSWISGKIQAELPVKTHSIQLLASQSTPSAMGVSNRTLDDGTLPLFTQGSIIGELNPTDKIRLRAAYTSFVFTDPSARTAEDSRYNGSTVLGNGPYIFAYEYAGNEIAADVRFTLFLDDELTLKVSEVKNEKAPEETNKGSGWRAEYKKKFDRYELIGAINGFRTESDAIPSAYGIEFSGFTNRIGYGASFKFSIPKQKIGFMAGYAKANVLNKLATASGTQADRDVFTLKTEIAYDLF